MKLEEKNREIADLRSKANPLVSGFPTGAGQQRRQQRSRGKAESGIEFDQLRDGRAQGRDRHAQGAGGEGEGRYVHRAARPGSLSQKALQETRDTLREATEGTSLSRHNFDNLKNECAALTQQNTVLQAQNDQLSRELSADQVERQSGRL